LDLSTASTLFDLGCGTGKICFQAFLQYRNLHYVYGVELSVGRYIIAEETALKMVQLLGADSFQIEINPGKSITIKEYLQEEVEIRENNSDDTTSASTSTQRTGRTLHFECGSLFDIENISIADIIMLETDIPNDLHVELCELLSNMHQGAKMLSYLDLRKIWCGDRNLCFKQVDNNKPLSDRYPTSWSVQRGHHFYLWNVVDPLTIMNLHHTSSGDESENERYYNKNRGDSNRSNRNLNGNSNLTDKCIPSINFSYFSSLFKQNNKNSKNNSNEREVVSYIIYLSIYYYFLF
jgi:SAM-dependent methyltransferase